MSLLLILHCLLYAQGAAFQVENVNVEDIYLIDYIDNVRVAELQLRNTTATRLTVEISFSMSPYVAQPVIQQVTLAPNASRTTSISAPLTAEIFNLEGPQAVKAIIHIQSKPPNSTTWQRDLLPMLYNIGYLNGATEIDRLRQAVRLITPDDTVITKQLTLFEVAQAPRDLQPDRCYRYLTDRLNPKKMVFPPYRAMLPRQLIHNRYGTQRDCLILYATLLESLGFHTALAYASAPAGTSNWLLLYSPATMPPSVEWNNRTWNVVALNDPHHTFDVACDQGQRMWNQLSPNSIQTVDAGATREQSPAFEPPPLEALELATQIRVGIEMARSGQTEAAKQQFQRILQTHQNNAAARNNLGNVSLQTGGLEGAISEYHLALDSKPEDARIYLNLGIAYYLLDERTESERVKEAFDHAYAGVSSYRNMCYALGLETETTVEDEYQAFRQLLKNAERRAAKKPPVRILGAKILREHPVYWKSGL